MRVPIGDARKAVFGPLDDGAGRSAAVVRRLGSAIALGIVEDGERLPSEARLAESLGVATVTLREALAELRSRGLVDTRRGRGGGNFVRADEAALAALARGRLEELGTADLRELGDVRAAVSGTSARLGAARASGAQLDRLEELIDRVGQAKTATAQLRAEGRFHIALASAAQSVRLAMQEIELQTELGQVAWGVTRSPGQLRADLRAHRATVAAMRERDGEQARALVEHQIGVVTRRLVDAHVALSRAGRSGDAGEQAG